MGKNNIYSAYRSASVAAAGSVSTTVQIKAPQRSIRLKSILVDLELFYTVSGLRLPNDSQTTQLFSCYISSPGTKLSKMFMVTAGTPLTNNGDYIRITKEGQIYFDGLFFINDINMIIQSNNVEAALAVTHNITIVLETEEEIIR